MTSLRELLLDSAGRAATYRESVADLPVFPTSLDLATARARLGDLQDDGCAPAAAVDQLCAAVEPLLVSSTGPRYFGFVTGGALDGATAADMLAVGWDQLAFNSVSSPGSAVVEEVAGAWLKELLGIPATASFGFVTGGQAANTVALAAARHHVLARAGWDVEQDGLSGAPEIRVLVNEDRHATIDRALRYLGLGMRCLVPVAADDQGAVDVGALERSLDAVPVGSPLIVCLQAGNVNSGAFDDFQAAVPLAHRAGAWVHVDGAFGLWAAASPSTRRQMAGCELADSWGADGHKWLNVPYDCGYTFCAHPGDHAAALSYTAAYLTGQGQGGLRSPGEFVPESSRRARGMATWTALRQLGRRGVVDLVDGCCARARQFAAELGSVPGVTIGNDVVLNQVLVAFGDDATTDRVVEAVQASGECWMGATTWRGRRYMRISVSSAATTVADVDRSVRAVVAAFRG